MGLDLIKAKLHVVVILTTLALSALFLAQGSTRLLVGGLLPPTPATATAAGAVPGRLPGADPPDGKAILGRNAFDPTTGSLWPPPRPIELPQGEGAGEAEQELAPGELPPACDGKVRLVASVYTEVLPEWSFATLAGSEGPPLLYREGGEIEGMQLVEVYPSAVLMRGGDGRLCSLALFRTQQEQAAAEKPKTPAGAAAPPAATEPTTTAFQGGISQEDLEKGIQKTSDTNYTVQRSLVDKVLENQAEIMRSARIVPFEQNGQVLGVKLYGIRRNSLLGMLGLQNGDLLRTINGYDMSKPDSALEAYSRLRSAAQLSLAVTRRGQATTVDYQIQQ